MWACSPDFAAEFNVVLLIHGGNSVRFTDTVL